jgi:hypothetical protein
VVSGEATDRFELGEERRIGPLPGDALQRELHVRRRDLAVVLEADAGGEVEREDCLFGVGLVGTGQAGKGLQLACVADQGVEELVDDHDRLGIAGVDRVEARETHHRDLQDAAHRPGGGRLAP